MKIIDNMCYTRVIYLLTNQKFMNSISDFKILNKPKFDLECISGYIETDIAFVINDFKNFSESYYTHTTEELLKIRRELNEGRK